MHVLLQENIGIVFKQQGKFEEAEQRYSETLQIRLKVFGEDSLDVAKTRMNIANIRNGQGRFAEALKIYTGVVQIQERVLGRNHPLVADTKNKYAFCFFGVSHVGRSRTTNLLINLFMCSIANVYQQQSKYTEALSMHHEVLEIRLKTFGPEHPLVADTKVGELLNLFFGFGRGI